MRTVVFGRTSSRAGSLQYSRRADFLCSAFNRMRDNVLREISINPDIEAVNNLGIIKQGAAEQIYLDLSRRCQNAPPTP